MIVGCVLDVAGIVGRMAFKDNFSDVDTYGRTDILLVTWWTYWKGGWCVEKGNVVSGKCFFVTGREFTSLGKAKGPLVDGVKHSCWWCM